MGFFRTFFREDNIILWTQVSTVGSFLYLFCKNTAFSNKWKKYTGKKNESGELVPVEAVLKFRFESILQTFDFSEWNKKYISLYINNDLDPNAFGSSSLKNGISVGVPEYYQRLSDEAIMKSVPIKYQTIDWNSAAGRRFLESLKLSEHAQKYIIACNVALVDGYYSIFDAMLPSFLIIGTYSCGSRMYSFCKLSRKPFLLTAAIYTLHLSFFTFLFLFMRDALFSIYFKAAEGRVSTFGVKYMMGGIEYFEKKIERNKALHELLPNSKRYTEDGNEVDIWAVKGLPDTVNLVGAKGRLEKFHVMEKVKEIPPVNPNPHPII